MDDESGAATQWLHAALGLKREETPFPWQTALLNDFRNGTPHSAIDIPTGLGKTSVMAIWLVARALGAAVPRRLAYIVDRRAVVDQATDVALRLRKFVEDAHEVKEKLGLQAKPLPVSTLRGQYVDIHADHQIRRVLVEVPPSCSLRPDDVQWAFSGLDVVAPDTGEAVATLIRTDDGDFLRNYGSRMTTLTVFGEPSRQPRFQRAPNGAEFTQREGIKKPRRGPNGNRSKCMPRQQSARHFVTREFACDQW